MTFRPALLAAAALSLCAAVASAQTTAPAAGAVAVLKIGKACKADIKAFCATVPKGKDRAVCLRTNETKVSPDCAKAIAARPAKWGRASPQ